MNDLFAIGFILITTHRIMSKPKVLSLAWLAPRLVPTLQYRGACVRQMPKTFEKILLYPPMPPMENEVSSIVS